MSSMGVVGCKSTSAADVDSIEGSARRTARVGCGYSSATGTALGVIGYRQSHRGLRNGPGINERPASRRIDYHL